MGRELSCLPPYSQDYDPIEETFSKAKRILRKVESRTRGTLHKAISAGISVLTAKDARGFFEHRG